MPPFVWGDFTDRHGNMEVETWRHGDMEVESQNGRRKMGCPPANYQRLGPSRGFHNLWSFGEPLYAASSGVISPEKSISDLVQEVASETQALSLTIIQDCRTAGFEYD
jgi:hypothetical protein